MRRIFVLVAFALAVHAAVMESAAQGKVGGYAPSSVADQSVQEAAAFAVKAQAESEGKARGLELVQILAAEEQVVAGMNFRLKLKLQVDGRERQAEAVIWWQPWRRPDPHRLTSWKWIPEQAAQ